MDNVVELAGVRVFVWPAEGSPICCEQDAIDLISDAFDAEVAVLAIPASRLGEAFLDLRSGVAGAVLQKLVNYRYRVAIVGDISEAVAASNALRDFVRESNRGEMVWFTDDLAILEGKLAG